MEFIKSLKLTEVVKESRSYEDMLLAQLERKTRVTESQEHPDAITMDVPLLVRVFELIREGVHDDVEIHNITERLLAIKDRGVLTMADYEEIAGPNKNGQVPEPKQQDESLDIAMLRALAGVKK
jgi:hypothetical protein